MEISNEPLNNEPVEQEEATERVNTRREYMRKYMKKRYEEEGDKVRAYSKSLKAKAKYNLSKEELSIYGIYLADVFKIRELFKKLPSEIQSKCLSEIQAH